MNTKATIDLARKHTQTCSRSMQSSAESCLADAIACHDRGDLVHAKERALKSLFYSVGIMHADYKRAAR